jgi:uncharacterized protein
MSLAEISESYVYVYIDPRNFEPFYYGKGKGSRKEAHSSSGDSRKAKRIKEIEAVGAKPIIRILARDLTEEQAFLVETAFIWQAEGRTLNEIPGKYVSKFRPYRTLHRQLPGFDSNQRIYFFNVGDGEHRTWEANVKYNYVGAGHGKRFRKEIQGLDEGNIIAAYLSHKGHGYVGVGRVITRAKPAREFRVNGRLLIDLKNIPEGILDKLGDDDECEWMATVKWIKTVPRYKAHFQKNAKLFVARGVRASLAKQQETVAFINERFGVDLFKLADEESDSAP